MAVLPVPGVPETKSDESVDWSSQEEMKALMISRSTVLPAMAEFPLHVERRSARARAWIGSSDMWGVGGGVVRARADMKVAGVVGRVCMLDVDACRATAEELFQLWVTKHSGETHWFGPGVV